MTTPERRPQPGDISGRRRKTDNVDGDVKIASSSDGDAEVSSVVNLFLPDADQADRSGSQRSKPLTDDDARRMTQTFGGAAPRQAAGEAAAAMPQAFGKYRVERFLGEGGFGRVYLARDDDLDRAVAVKVPRPERFETEEDVKQFLAEARTLAGLKHPGIVTVYDYGRTNAGDCYVVMEYVDGCTLGEWQRGRPLPVGRVVDVVAQVAEAVHAAHLKSFVHRDLKPANILVDKTGRPCVTDFGLAVSDCNQRSHRGQIAGTLAYMAPEQIRGEIQFIDGRTDIWALGVILYELLTGRTPFTGDTASAIVDEVQHREPRPLRAINEQIPAELENIALKCLAKPVTSRYRTASDLAQALRNSAARVADRVEPAKPSRTISLNLQTLSRRPLGCALSLTFCLVLFAVGALVVPAMLDRGSSDSHVRNIAELIETQNYEGARIELNALKESDPEIWNETEVQQLAAQLRTADEQRKAEFEILSVRLLESNPRNLKAEDIDRLEQLASSTEEKQLVAELCAARERALMDGISPDGNSPSTGSSDANPRDASEQDPSGPLRGPAYRLDLAKERAIVSIRLDSMIPEDTVRLELLSFDNFKQTLSVLPASKRIAVGEQARIVIGRPQEAEIRIDFRADSDGYRVVFEPMVEIAGRQQSFAAPQVLAEQENLTERLLDAHAELAKARTELAAIEGQIAALQPQVSSATGSRRESLNQKIMDLKAEATSRQDIIRRGETLTADMVEPLQQSMYAAALGHSLHGNAQVKFRIVAQTGGEPLVLYSAESNAATPASAAPSFGDVESYGGPTGRFISQTKSWVYDVLADGTFSVRSLPDGTNVSKGEWQEAQQQVRLRALTGGTEVYRIAGRMELSGPNGVLLRIPRID